MKLTWHVRPLHGRETPAINPQDACGRVSGIGSNFQAIVVSPPLCRKCVAVSRQDYMHPAQGPADIRQTTTVALVSVPDINLPT